jgi:hypothetical protein
MFVWCAAVQIDIFFGHRFFAGDKDGGRPSPYQALGASFFHF